MLHFIRIGILAVLAVLAQQIFANYDHDYSGCYRDLTDHIPQYLLQVFVNPKKYLQGPSANKKIGRKHFAIVGSGAAGLTSAYLLLNAGHKVTMLEAQNRIGGRIYTHYGQGWFGDLGAMRFPDWQYLIFGIIEHLKIPLTPFTHYSKNAQSYFWLNDIYYNVNDLGWLDNGNKNEKKLKQLYDLFNITNPPKDADGTLQCPRILADQFYGLTFDAKKMCHDDVTLAQVMRDFLKDKGAHENFFNMFATLELLRVYYDHTSQEYFIDLGQREYEVPSKEETTLVQPTKYSDGYREIVNGTAVLTETLLSKCRKFGRRFRLRMNSRVTKVRQLKKSVQLYVEKKARLSGGNWRKRSRASSRGRVKRYRYGGFHYVIMTPTAKEVSIMKFAPKLPYQKLEALDSLRYFGSVKVFLKFSKPFWAEPNKLPIIFYDKADSGMGGSGVSDDPLKVTYYPSNPLHGPSLLATYTWEGESDFWLSLTDEECIQYALDAMVERHGAVARKTFEEGVVKKWSLDSYSHGAFVQQGVFQRHYFMKHLMDPFGKIIFSAEYANKFHNGWVESALESAIRNLVNLWPDQYLKDFGKQEEAFFKEEEELFNSNSSYGH